jgi:cholesterol transport system auxiliary component
LFHRIAPRKDDSASTKLQNAFARAFAVLCVALAAAGCAGPAATTYDLTPVNAPATRAMRGLLRIAEPVASIDLDSDRILVRGQDDTLAVLPGARWADRLPALVQARLRNTLENAGLSRDLASGGAAANYELDLDIRAFELAAAQRAVHIDIAAKMISLAGGRVVGAEIFRETQPVETSDPVAVTSALNAALSRILPRLVAFAATSG